MHLGGDSGRWHAVDDFNAVDCFMTGWTVGGPCRESMTDVVAVMRGAVGFQCSAIPVSVKQR